VEQMRVLIADDNKEFASILRDYLEEQEDIDVVGVAYNGLEALTLILEFMPDIVVLDVVMPYLDGIGVLEKLSERQLADRPKILMLSAFGQDSITRRAAELGADYYLVKPFDLATLAERLRQMFYWREPDATARRIRMEEESLDVLVTSILQKMGMPSNIKGFRYLRDAIIMVHYRPEYLSAVTKELYPEIAKKYSTTSSRVERAIRHAIQVAWNRGNIGFIEKLFGSVPGKSKRRPTNSEFIAFMADRIRSGIYSMNDIMPGLL